MTRSSHYLDCPAWKWNVGNADECTCDLKAPERSAIAKVKAREAKREKIARALAASDYPDVPEPGAVDYRRAEAVLAALEED